MSRALRRPGYALSVAEARQRAERNAEAAVQACLAAGVGESEPPTFKRFGLPLVNGFTGTAYVVRDRFGLCAFEGRVARGPNDANEFLTALVVPLNCRPTQLMLLTTIGLDDDLGAGWSHAYLYASGALTIYAKTTALAGVTLAGPVWYGR